MAKVMCKKNSSPVGLGSIVRNNHYGSRLLKVVKINGMNQVFIKSYGKTHYGKFIPSTRPKMIEGFLHPLDKSIVCIPSHNGDYWMYQHVSPQWEGYDKYNEWPHKGN